MLFTMTVNSMEMESKYITYFAVARKEIILMPKMAYKFNYLALVDPKNVMLCGSYPECISHISGDNNY